jgi:thioredoxin 1
MATMSLTKESFEQTLEDNDIVLIDFWASWCGPCRMFAPVYEKVSESHPGVVFAKVDTEAEPELAGAFNIQSIPTLMAVRDKIVLYSQPGALPEDALEDIVRQVEALDMDEVRKEVADSQSGSQAG